MSVTLRSLEEDLHDMERLLRSEDYIGIVYEMDNDIPAPAKNAYIRKIAQVRDRIRSLAERFDLEREQKSLIRQLSARLTYDWTTIEEIKTRHLRGYGTTAEGLKETLDPELDAIIGLIQEMERLLNG
jgi:hypothetical protein